MAQDKSLSTKLQISLDPRIVIGILLVIIVVMLLLWRPWGGRPGSERTLEVKGETTITARPDEFVFYPSYQVKGPDKSAALGELSKKSEELVAKLKELGVSENKIKTNTTSYDYWEGQAKDPTYTLQLVVTLPNMEQAQKIQDYLITTLPTGSISPQAGFSDTKRKQLETDARGKAIEDAKQKANRTAKELGFRLAKIKAVSDGSGFGDFPTMEARSAADNSVQASPSGSLGVNPGENKLSYMVTVVYFIR